ncbi:MAG: hypothetical protein AB7F89_25305 [Pirellulaceae bacterium]
MATNTTNPNTTANTNDRVYMAETGVARPVMGVFSSRNKVEAALEALRNAGFANSQIGVIARNQGDWAPPESVTASGQDTGAAAGAASGAVAGAGLGGLWALGIAAGLLPAIGPVVAGGLLGSVLASAAAGAAAGTLAGALIGLGLSEEEATFYEGEITAGRMVVSVQAGNRTAEAEGILRQHGAYDVDNPQRGGTL